MRWALVLPLLGGCVLGDSAVPPGRKVIDVYHDPDGTGDSKGPSITITNEPGAGAPPRIQPVIYPPRILAVWVAEHLDRERDMKIGAHYVYIKLRDSSWTEEPIDREPSGSEISGEASAEDLARLRRQVGRNLGGILLPYRVEGGSGTSLDRPETGKGKRDSEIDGSEEGEE